VAGALSETDYRAKLAAAGFEGVDVEATREYGLDDARALLTEEERNDESLARDVAGKLVSAFVRAAKPAACCAPSCCAA
jgi:hypothetical protein